MVRIDRRCDPHRRSISCHRGHRAATASSVVLYHLVVMKRRLLLLLPFLLASLTHAEKTLFDLKQLKASDGFHIAVFASVDGPRMLTFTPAAYCW
jgi:hypothetical protein